VIVAPPVELEQVLVQGARRRLRGGSLPRMDGNRQEHMVFLADSDLEVPDVRRGCVHLRIPVKVITCSTPNVITDSTESDRLTERSDAGVRL